MNLEDDLANQGSHVALLSGFNLHIWTCWCGQRCCGDVNPVVVVVVVNVARPLQLPEVVLIKDEDSDSNDTFEDGECEPRVPQPESPNPWLGAPDKASGCAHGNALEFSGGWWDYGADVDGYRQEVIDTTDLISTPYWPGTFLTILSVPFLLLCRKQD